jgi:hypothetical protein
MFREKMGERQSTVHIEGGGPVNLTKKICPEKVLFKRLPRSDP